MFLNIIRMFMDKIKANIVKKTNDNALPLPSYISIRHLGL